MPGARHARPPVERTAEVIRISLDEALAARAVGRQHAEAFLVILSRGAVVGQTTVAAREVLTVDEQARAIEACCGERIRRQDGVRRFRAAAGAPNRQFGQPAVSVVVCTRDRPEHLRECLASLAELRAPPREVIVVDSASGSHATRDVCADFRVRYLQENRPGLSRARNRAVAEAVGDVIAFTDDDVSVDASWLDDLGASLADSLVMAVTGFVAPFELDTPAQVAFETHGGFGRGFEPTIFNGAFASPYRQAAASGVGANLIIRRSAFSDIGLFDEALGSGTAVASAEDTDILYRILDRGFRVSYEPERIVWHRHRRDPDALRRVLYGYAVGVSAHATLGLVRHHDLGAGRTLAWWCGRYLTRDVASVVRSRGSREIPARAVAAELAGTVAGPLLLASSKWSHRQLPTPPERRVETRKSVTVTVTREYPRMSVVIPSHERRTVLSKVLRALQEQTWPAEHLEIVVALDGSTDGSAEMVRAMGATLPLTLIEQANVGAAKARNAGVDATTGPVMIFLDDDVIPDVNFVRGHAETHARGSVRTVALGYCATPIRRNGVWALALRSWWEDRFRRMAEPDHPWTYGDFQSLNVSLHRTLFAERGGFDTRFGTARREDWELGLRLLQHGADFIYAPEASASHELDASFSTSLRHRRLEAIGDLVFLEAHPNLLSRLPLAGMLRDITPRLRARLLSPEEPDRRRDRILRASLQALQAAGLRGRWLGTAFELLHGAYIDGLRDAMPDAGERADLLRRAAHAPPAPVVWLDRPPAKIIIPPEGLGAVSVGKDGAILGTVTAMEPSGQWDWREISERIAWEVDWSAAPTDAEASDPFGTREAASPRGVGDAGR